MDSVARSSSEAGYLRSDQDGRMGQDGLISAEIMLASPKELKRFMTASPL
jgi:hypothetical protein